MGSGQADERIRAQSIIQLLQYTKEYLAELSQQIVSLLPLHDPAMVRVRGDSI